VENFWDNDLIDKEFCRKYSYNFESLANVSFRRAAKALEIHMSGEVTFYMTALQAC
jgi:hypothetical protein